MFVGEGNATTYPTRSIPIHDLLQPEDGAPPQARPAHRHEGIHHQQIDHRVPPSNGGAKRGKFVGEGNATTYPTRSIPIHDLLQPEDDAPPQARPAHRHKGIHHQQIDHRVPPSNGGAKRGKFVGEGNATTYPTRSIPIHDLLQPEDDAPPQARPAHRHKGIHHQQIDHRVPPSSGGAKRGKFVGEGNATTYPTRSIPIHDLLQPEDGAPPQARPAHRHEGIHHQQIDHRVPPSNGGAKRGKFVGEGNATTYPTRSIPIHDLLQPEDDAPPQDRPAHR